MERVKSLIKNEFEVLSHEENREDYICTRTDCWNDEETKTKALAQWLSHKQLHPIDLKWHIKTEKFTKS